MACEHHMGLTLALREGVSISRIASGRARHTRDHVLEGIRTVSLSSNTSNPVVELVAGLSQSTTREKAASEASTFATVRIKQRVGPLAGPVGNGGILFEWVRPPIRENDRC